MCHVLSHKGGSFQSPSKSKHLKNHEVRLVAFQQSKFINFHDSVWTGDTYLLSSKAAHNSQFPSKGSIYLVYVNAQQKDQLRDLRNPRAWNDEVLHLTLDVYLGSVNPGYCSNLRRALEEFRRQTLFDGSAYSGEIAMTTALPTLLSNTWKMFWKVSLDATLKTCAWQGSMLRGYRVEDACVFLRYVGLVHAKHFI